MYIQNKKMADKKLTSVKIDEKLWDDFRIAAVKYKFNFSNLTERTIDLYLNDEDFRKKIHNHKVNLK